MTQRRRLPWKRRSTTVAATVASHKVFITMGEYEDGTLGEVFIDMHKEGAAFRSVMNCVAILTSLCLQHGVPLSLLVERFSGIKFEPAGVVQGHPNITTASSVIDYIFRAIGDEYLKESSK